MPKVTNVFPVPVTDENTINAMLKNNIAPQIIGKRFIEPVMRLKLVV
jgi:hypothetical protein